MVRVCHGWGAFFLNLAQMSWLGIPMSTNGTALYRYLVPGILTVVVWIPRWRVTVGVSGYDRC